MKNPENSGDALKVLHVITRFILGGAQENTFLTVKYQGKDPGFCVDICTGPPLGPEGSMMDELESLPDVRVFKVDELRREINPLLDFISLVKIYSLIKKGGYDIVHTHSSKAGILGRIAARAAGTRVVVHTIHGLPFHPYQSWILNFFYVVLEKFCAIFSSRIITVCDAMTDKAVAAGVASPCRFETVYSGMDIDGFLLIEEKSRRLIEKFGIREDEVVIGKIARLFPLKGHDYFLKAAAEIAAARPNVKFLLVGDGILMDNIKKSVNDTGLSSRFIFAGLVNRAEIPEYISVMDIVVHTSVREGLARVLPQALASGRPVVSFDIDGAREVVINGRTGALIAPGDVDGVVKAVLGFIDDPAKARDTGLSGRSLVKDIFSEKAMAGHIKRVYNDVLREMR